MVLHLCMEIYLIHGAGEMKLGSSIHGVTISGCLEGFNQTSVACWWGCQQTSSLVPPALRIPVAFTKLHPTPVGLESNRRFAEDHSTEVFQKIWSWSWKGRAPGSHVHWLCCFLCASESTHNKQTGKGNRWMWKITGRMFDSGLDFEAKFGSSFLLLTSFACFWRWIQFLPCISSSLQHLTFLHFL